MGKPKAQPKPEAKKGTPSKGKAGAKAAKVKADGNADAKCRAKRGTAGTFAGRRPPADAMKRAEFDHIKYSYMTLRLQGISDEALAAGAARPAKKARAQSATTQHVFLTAMRTRLVELAKAGVPGPDRMSTAVAEWRGRAAELV
jgi:hypothetical protein